MTNTAQELREGAALLSHLWELLQATPLGTMLDNKPLLAALSLLNETQARAEAAAADAKRAAIAAHEAARATTAAKTDMQLALLAHLTQEKR
jgi:topoisomerase IA-like protein